MVAHLKLKVEFTMSVLDHIEIPVADGASAKLFYSRTLSALGMSIVIDVPSHRTKFGGMRCGFGINGYPCFWIHDQDSHTACIHIAFKADSIEQVDELYRLALINGGSDNGPPGIRDHYHDDYYAAYVFDPDRNNIEFVYQPKA